MVKNPGTSRIHERIPAATKLKSLFSWAMTNPSKEFHSKSVYNFFNYLAYNWYKRAGPKHKLIRDIRQQCGE